MMLRTSDGVSTAFLLQGRKTKEQRLEERTREDTRKESAYKLTHNLQQTQIRATQKCRTTIEGLQPQTHNLRHTRPQTHTGSPTTSDARKNPQCNNKQRQAMHFLSLSKGTHVKPNSLKTGSKAADTANSSSMTGPCE